MKAIELIENALQSGIFSSGLTNISSQGASDKQIEEAETQLGRELSEEHKKLLRRWNGGHFDVFRLHSTSEILNYIEWDELPVVNDKLSVCFASTPLGYVYAEDWVGNIWSFDTDGGNLNKIAPAFSVFFARCVFGDGARIFGGDDWAEKINSLV